MVAPGGLYSWDLQGLPRLYRQIFMSRASEKDTGFALLLFVS